MISFGMTIGGRSVVGQESFGVINPALDAHFAAAPDCTREELDLAVDAARVAFRSWKNVPIRDRQACLIAMADILTRNADPVAEVLVQEQGKPTHYARGEVLAAAHWCREFAKHTLEPVVLEDNSDFEIVLHRRPIGVVGAFTPWNGPIASAFIKIAPAILAGNSVVLKPSPLTPLSTLMIGELLIGTVPAGVLNVITGSDRLGPWLAEHPGVDKVSFTGSIGTGRKVMASASKTLKRITLELGGNDPAIVLADVDIASTVEALFVGAFRNAGQVCAASKRIFIHESIYDNFRDAFVARAERAIVGAGDQVGSEMGPLQNRAQYDRVQDLIAKTAAAGYRCLAGGTVDQQTGYFIRPTIIDDPPDSAEIVAEEQFGPVVPLLRFSSIDEVIERANRSPYGLGASVWSLNETQAAKVADQLDCGVVWINMIMYLSPNFPFGGHKQSGIGVESGLDGLLSFTNCHTTVARK